MSTIYPNQIDTLTSLPKVTDNIDEVDANSVNRLRDAIVVIESELGTNPRDGYSTVSQRFSNIDTQLSSINTEISTIDTTINNELANIRGTTIKLGLPSGGFDAGQFSLDQNDYITDRINDINAILKYLSPAAAKSMDNLSLDELSPITKYSAYLSSVAGAVYDGIAPAGTLVDNIIVATTYSLTTHDTEDSLSGFSDADAGTIILFRNNISSGTFNLGTAFVEADRANSGGQDSSYDSGNGIPRVVNSLLTIQSVKLFNNFPALQKGVIYITETSPANGLNAYYIRHTVNLVNRDSQTYKVWYDAGSTTAPIFSVAPTLVESSPLPYKYLSGISWLKNGSKLIAATTISNAFKNTYTLSSLSATVDNGFTSSLSFNTLTDSGASNPPLSTQTYALNKELTINTSNTQSIVNKINFSYTRNPYTSTITASSTQSNMLINTYGNVSTDSTEEFRDENYRLTSTNVTSLVSSLGSSPGITGNWNSTTALSNGNAQVYNDKLIYPTINFTSGYIPTQTLDYSSFSGNQVYYRAFKSSNSVSQGTIQVYGNISLSDIQSTMKIEIKLPGISGWKDLGVAFNNTTFNTNIAVDGVGCLTGSGSISGGIQFGWSMGTFSTSQTNNLYVMRITLTSNIYGNSGAKTIDKIVETFTGVF